MKKLLLALLLLPALATFGQVAIRPITQINDVNKVGQEYYSKPVTWFQGDSIKFDVLARDVRTPIDFTGQAFPVLFVTSETNRQIVYIAQTGTVVTATNGHVSVTIPADGATLDTNQNYASWMIVFRETGGTTAEVATVAYSQTRVLPSPLGVTYTNVAPATNFYIDVDGILSEYDPVFTASVAATISASLTGQWSEAYSWGNAATQNLGSGWSGYAATQNVNFAQYYATNIGGIDFDTTPSGSPQPARIQWNSSRSTLDLGINENINLDVGQQLMLFAKSIETNTINKGEVVFVAGASGDNPTIKRASNETEPLSARTIGIAAETIASNNNGIVVTAGTVYNINTTNFTQGANLYLGANGTLQTNLPTAPLHGVFIGVVERVGENNGQIFVHVQNYQEIEELSDVNVKGRQVNDLLLWNGTVWTNKPETDPVWSAASSLYYTASQADSLFATGSPLYAVDLSPYATGTPLYSFTEADPVWTSASTGYYTIVAADAKFATGSPIYSIAGLATGSPLYAFTEADPIWTAASSSYYTASQADAIFATGTPIYSVAGLATGSPLYAFTETDPVWAAASNLYATTAGVATITANYLPLAGGTMNNGAILNMDEGKITNITAVGNFGGQNQYFDFEEGKFFGYWQFGETPSVPGYFPLTSGVILSNYFEIVKPAFPYAKYDAGLISASNEFGSINAVSIAPDMYLQAINASGLKFIDMSSDLVVIQPGIQILDPQTNAYITITVTGGLQVGTASFRALPTGDISQDTTNTATLGIVTAETVTASFFGNGAGITNLNLAAYGLATGTPLYAYTETDPIWAGASNLYYLASNPSNFLTSYTETDPIWSAASSLYYTASQADTLFATGSPVYDVSGLATGTPLYSVDLSGYATGTPIYAYTETDPIWTSASSLYYTITAADAKFATGTPIYSISGKLDSNTWAAADSTTNYQTRTGFISASNAINTRLVAVEGYTNRAASALASSVWASAASTTNAAPLDAYVAFTTAYAIAQSTTNAAPLDAWTAFTSSYAVADSTTNYASRVDFIAFTNTYSIGDWSSFAATQTVNLGQQNLTNAASITRATNSIDFNAGTLGGSWTFNSQPTVPGYLTTNGNASGLVNFPSSILTVSAGNTNYLRYTTANPTNATYSGNWNQFTYTYRDATSIIMKVYGPSNKWYGIIMNELPIE